MTEKKYLIQDIVPADTADLLSIMQDTKAAGYRLGQACTTLTEDKSELEVLYTFEKKNVLKSYKVIIDAKTPEVQSITVVYPYAFIYENEMHDLFGIEFKNLILDYKGKYIVLPETAPCNPSLEEGGEN